MEIRPIKIKDSTDVNYGKEGVIVKQVHSDRKDQQKFTLLFNHEGEPELKEYYEDQFDVQQGKLSQCTSMNIQCSKWKGVGE